MFLIKVRNGLLKPQFLNGFIYIFMLLAENIFAQHLDTIQYSHFSTDIRLSNNEFLKGISLNCKKNVLHASYDSISELLTIQTNYNEKNIELIVYDLKTKKLLWRKLVNFKKNEIVILNKYILLSNKDKTICYNKLDGNEIWHSRRELMYVNQKNEVAFSYYTHFDKSNPDKLIEAISLSDGKKIWTRNIDRYYGWNEIKNINDSTILLSASGLHFINLKNGKGWDYDALTGETIPHTNSPLINAAVFASNMAFGLMGGYTVFYFTHTEDLYWDLCSNIVISEKQIYYASKQTITSIDFNGNVIWQTKLPKDITGNSVLALHDSLILLINKGYALKGKETIFYGTPFLACFDKKNGAQFYLKKISLEANAITDFRIINSAYYLLQKNKIGIYSLENGEFINWELISDIQKQKNNAFIDPQNFLIKDYSTSQISQKYDSLLYILLPQNGIIAFNNQLVEKDRINYENLLFKSHTTDDYLFFVNKDEIIVTEKNMKQVGRIKIKNQPIFYNNKILFFNEEKVNIVNLDEIKK